MRIEKEIGANKEEKIIDPTKVRSFSYSFPSNFFFITLLFFSLIHSLFRSFPFSSPKNCLENDFCSFLLPPFNFVIFSHSFFFAFYPRLFLSSFLIAIALVSFLPAPYIISQERQSFNTPTLTAVFRSSNFSPFSIALLYCISFFSLSSSFIYFFFFSKSLIPTHDQPFVFSINEILF